MTEPFRVRDLYLHQHITEIDCTPGQDLVACAVKSVDEANDSYVSCIWSFRADGDGAVQLTRGPGQDTCPRWSPEGSQLAFTSNRSGTLQVYLMERSGGEAWQVGEFQQGVSDLHWAPDSLSMVVTAAVTVDPDLHGARAHGQAPSPKAATTKCKPEVAWRLPYKEDGVGFLLQREFHLFRLDARTGHTRQLTDGPFDVLGFDLSPDGQHIAYTRTREGRYAHNNDLWVCAADGSQPRQLTDRHAIVMQPCWSPDGRRLVFTGALGEGDAEPRLWLVDVASGEVRALCSDSVDVADPTSIQWATDGQSLVLSRAHRGRHQIVQLRLADEQLEVIAGGDRQLGVFGCTAHHLVYSIDHPSCPSELWARPRPASGAADERQLSNFNPWWHERTPIEAQALAFDVPDGVGGTERIEGWLLRERGCNRPLPLLNDVHGGPASYALLDFDSNVFWQALCAQGWAVLALNAVGSASYGRAFCNRLAGHWGERDLPQHLAAIQQLTADGVCDGRVAVSGKSYGGYLSAYATGNTRRFMAAVVMAPVGNIETHYGTSDGGYYADPFYMASKPRFDRALAKQLSPLNHIEKSTTPTLFLQGKEDERCPKCQSEELFVSLYRAGDTPAELVLYPGETHGFLGKGAPSCRDDAASRIMDWLLRFSGDAGSGSPRNEGLEPGA